MGRGRIPASRRALLLVVLAGLAACGYRLGVPAGSRFGSPELRIDLRPFSNATVIPDAGAVLASELRGELRRAGFRGTFERTGADYLIDGKVADLRLDVASHVTETRFALELRLSLAVDIRVVEIARGRVLWREEKLSESVSYYAGADAQYTEANKRMAFEEASRRIARRVGQTLRVLL